MDARADHSDLPDEAQQHLEQAYAYEENGEFKAVRLDPAFAEAKENLSEAEADLGGKAKAIEVERNAAPREQERRTPRRVYWWLLLSPFMRVPCFAYQLFGLYRPSVGERIWAAIVPLVFHIPLLLMGLGVDNRFVRRHMQQALLLIALRAGMAAIALNLGDYPEEGLWLFFFGNGALWLFGSLWGLRQVKRGDCWLMRQRGEDDELPRPWAVVSATAAGAPATVPTGVAVSPLPAVHSPLEPSADPNAAFEEGLRLLSEGERAEATARFLVTFRNGAPALRRRVLAELEEMGEVEVF